MYKNVLAAVNEHLNSEVSARYALHLAKESAARIHFCSIAENGLDKKGFYAAEEAVKRLAHRARELGVKAECILKTGGPLEEIKKIVAAENIDIVFAAARREDIEKRFFARTVSRRLSLALPCSVALVRVVHLGRVHPKNILVPLKARIDHGAERARFVAIMAKAFDARLSLLHAAQPLGRFLNNEIHLTQQEREARLSPDIVSFIDELDRQGIAHDKKLIPGIAGLTITIEAAAKRHDLIIMGASDRSLLNSLIRGNPMERVLRETICDLIILRPRM